LCRGFLLPFHNLRAVFNSPKPLCRFEQEF
jgi:hypothetical protein